jgi:arginase
VDVALIQVPYMAGDDRHGSREGPRRLVEGGAVTTLEDQGVGVRVEAIERPGPFRDTASSTAAVNAALAGAVRDALAQGRLPLVVAGSCVAAHGVLAGYDHSRSGVLWIDAHADFNTPESTASGFFPGMTTAVLVGHCYAGYWGGIGDNTPVEEEAIVMFGVRELSPDAERERLAQSKIRVLEWRDRMPTGDIERELDRLAERVEDAYLHVDLDAFDPDVAPGVVDEPVPGGLAFSDAESAIAALAQRVPIRAVTLATFNPERDRDDRTLRTALELVRLVGQIAAAQSED